MAERPSILVLRLSSLGDVLFALPAVERLVASGVARRVAWLVEDRAASLLEMVDGLDEVVVFPRRDKARWAAFARALRRRDDDVVLDLQSNFKSRMQRLFLRAPRKLGYDLPLAKEGAHKGLTEAFLPPSHAQHRVASHISMLSLLGVSAPVPVPRPQLTWSASVEQQAADVVAGRPGAGPLVVLHPGTSAFGELKRWPTEHFAALGQRLADEHGARLLVTGGPGEESLVAAVVRGLGSRARAVPPAGLPTLTALLARVDLVVAADSLPLHLANALGTPVVALYGPKDPAVTGPFFDRAVVARAGVACSPCTLRRCDDRICMQRLLPDAVARNAACALAFGRLVATTANVTATADVTAEDAAAVADDDEPPLTARSAP